jgi:hypothetical protein
MNLIKYPKVWRCYKCCDLLVEQVVKNGYSPTKKGMHTHQ